MVGTVQQFGTDGNDGRSELIQLVLYRIKVPCSSHCFQIEKSGRQDFLHMIDRPSINKDIKIDKGQVRAEPMLLLYLLTIQLSSKRMGNQPLIQIRSMSGPAALICQTRKLIAD